MTDDNANFDPSQNSFERMGDEEFALTLHKLTKEVDPSYDIDEEFLAFMDADEILHQEILEKVIPALAEKNVQFQTDITQIDLQMYIRETRLYFAHIIASSVCEITFHKFNSILLETIAKISRDVEISPEEKDAYFQVIEEVVGDEHFHAAMRQISETNYLDDNMLFEQKVEERRKFLLIERDQLYDELVQAGVNPNHDDFESFITKVTLYGYNIDENDLASLLTNSHLNLKEQVLRIARLLSIVEKCPAILQRYHVDLDDFEA